MNSSFLEPGSLQARDRGVIIGDTGRHAIMDINDHQLRVVQTSGYNNVDAEELEDLSTNGAKPKKGIKFHVRKGPLRKQKDLAQVSTKLLVCKTINK